jgi:cytochrome c553
MKKINIILLSITLVFIGCGEVTTSGKDRVVTTQNTTNNSTVNNSSANENINTQKIYDKCAGCHGKNGEKFALGKSKVIGGENKEALLYQLQEYKTGRLNQYGMGQLMKGQVVGLSHSELESVSEYVSKLSGIEE